MPDKGRVRIVTDSTSDIPGALASELSISVVPCQVYFGDEAYRDGVDLTPEAFHRKLAEASQLPRTSQPPVSDFVDTYHQILEADHSVGVVSIHVAGNLSGTVNAAWAAAQMMADPSRVTVIDSGQLSMGLGWAVIEAAHIAQTGATPAEISRAAHAMLPRLRVAAMIDTLENLYEGGRINQISAILGTALRIKPLLSVRNGHVSVVGQVRTRSRALKRLAAVVRDWGPLARMAVLHTGAEQPAQSLAEMLDDLAPASESMIGAAGPALTTHLGIGAVGVCAMTAADS
jgi:DegV family protein with EDD domain